jgi:hypothetical protein
MPQLVLIVLALIIAAIFGARFCAGSSSNAGCGGCGLGGTGSSNAGVAEGSAAAAEAPTQPTAPPAPVAPPEVAAPPTVPDQVRVLVTGNEIRVNDALVPNVQSAVELLRQPSGTIELSIPGNASASTASELRIALDENNIDYQIAQ